MNTANHCPECNAVGRDGLTCRDHFDQMLAWEFEDPGGAGAVHHLTVLCYNLQHPRVYSPEGLVAAQTLLVQFVADGLSPQQVRNQIGAGHDSAKRAYRITGSSGTQGSYARPVQWTVTIGDVAAGGLDGYCERVTAWAVSVLEALRAGGILDHP